MHTATGRTARFSVTPAALAAFFITAMLLAGCSPTGSADATPQAESEPKTAASSAKVQGVLDVGHPDDLPLWEGAAVVSSTLPGESIYELELTTSDPIADVVYGVGKGLEGEGFTVEALEESDETTVMMAIKGDLAALYTITKADAGTSIVVSAQLPLAQ